MTLNPWGGVDRLEGVKIYQTDYFCIISLQHTTSDKRTLYSPGKCFGSSCCCLMIAQFINSKLIGFLGHCGSLPGYYRSFRVPPATQSVKGLNWTERIDDGCHWPIWLIFLLLLLLFFALMWQLASLWNTDKIWCDIIPTMFYSLSPSMLLKEERFTKYEWWLFSGLTAFLRVQGLRPTAVEECEERGAQSAGHVLGSRSAQ